MSIVTPSRALMLSVLTIAAAVPSLPAATIDTFSFTQNGWDTTTVVAGGKAEPAGTDPGGILTGSFTGTLEPSGLIELADLSSFSARYGDSSFPLVFSLTLAQISSFSFSTQGGNSSLDVAELSGEAQVCIGAAVSLDSNCTAAFGLSYPAGTNGIILSGFFFPGLITSSAPVITLLSSTTTPAPEPISLALLGGGLIAVALWKRQPKRMIAQFSDPAVRADDKRQ